MGSGENVWPYYNRVVRAGACDSIVEDIGWSSSLMFVVGLVLFPLCAMVTHRFLVQWAEWAAAQEASKAAQKNRYWQCRLRVKKIADSTMIVWRNVFSSSQYSDALWK